MKETNEPQNAVSPGASFFRTLMYSATSALLYCLGALAAPVGVVGTLFSPVPLVLLGARENKKWMLAGLAAVSVFFAAFLNPWLAAEFLLLEGLLCLGLTLPLGRVEKGGEALFFCVVVSIVGKVFLMALVVSLKGRNPFAPDPEFLRQVFAAAYPETYLKSGDTLAFKQFVDQMSKIIPYMFPSLLIMSAAFDSFINYRMCEALQRKRAVVFPPLPPLGEWRFPKSLLWALLFVMLMPLIVEVENLPLWDMTDLNLKFLLSMLFLLQGLSFFWWWQKKHRVHILLRIFFTLIFLIPHLNIVMIVLGVTDLCLDLRNRKRKTEDA